MKNILGRHILIEAYDCDPEILDDIKVVEETMENAALRAGAEVREVAFHKFSPQGVSGVVVISESHLSVHTWPEFGYAAVDVFTCGDTVDPMVAVDYIRDGFKARRALTSEVKRGIFDEHYIAKISPG
ncbi:MAG: S-adenosylmethionine decarboxylase proenzyme [Firmicutes bacterium]|jgi:S-adenosylmethionine decarboxylase|nr:S-adenosylmethionine decarboxylase proenzyme [Bacillota bacterium]